MKCEYAQLFLNELTDNQLTNDQVKHIQEHVANCPQCTTRLATIINIKQQLQAIQLADNISDEFIRKAIANAEHQNSTAVREQTSLFKTSHISIAASFIILFSISLLLWKPEAQHNAPANLLSQQQVNLLFEAPKALNNVTFTIYLPEHVEMKGHPGTRQIRWQGNIKKGKNLLSIPIIKNNINDGIITTELEYQNNKRLFEINIQSNDTFKQLT